MKTKVRFNVLNGAIYLTAAGAAFVKDLNSISPSGITDHIYASLLLLYTNITDTAHRGRVLQCLGMSPRWSSVDIFDNLLRNRFFVQVIPNPNDEDRVDYAHGRRVC